MKYLILTSLVVLSGCSYPISDSHDTVYSPTIITNSNIPVPPNNWSWNKNSGYRENYQEPPLYMRHRPYYDR